MWTLLIDFADINECSDGIHSCQQICNNTAGSHYCLCFDGYELSSDGYSCTGQILCRAIYTWLSNKELACIIWMFVRQSVLIWQLYVAILFIHCPCPLYVPFAWWDDRCTRGRTSCDLLRFMIHINNSWYTNSDLWGVTKIFACVHVQILMNVLTKWMNVISTGSIHMRDSGYTLNSDGLYCDGTQKKKITS